MNQSFKCPECQGELEQKIVTHDFRFQGRLYSFQDVPARVCSSCGVVFLDASVAKRIEETLKKRLEPERYSQVPVFSLEHLPA